MDGPAFEVRVVRLEPGARRPYRREDWHDALVLVERGEVELEGLAGGRATFRRGSVLCLDGVSVRGLRNRSAEAAWLVTVVRAEND